VVRLAAGIDPTLELIVAELTRVTRPELVLLFGSRATGAPREDSDYDLMVVFADDADVAREERVCREALWGAKISADILTRTASQYRRRQHDPGFLDWLVAREGRALYSTGNVEQRSPAGRVREEREADGVTLWRERAAADLKAAQLSAGSDTPVSDAMCFHAHASIEKLLKAEIVSFGAFPPRTHDLLELLQMQPPRLRGDVVLRSACELLQALYPKSRYPEQPMPTLDEAKQALQAALEARERFR
jgi:HEPN domain-containing protein/predicted nucleotidyltransferase